jgi:hypothetical protein
VFEIGAISAGRSKSAASCSPGSLWAGDNNERFKIVSGLWLFHTGRGKIHRALEFSDELFRLAEQRNDDDLRLQAHHSAWGSLTFLGDFAASREHHRTAE